MNGDLNKITNLVAHAGLLHGSECKRLLALGKLKLNGHKAKKENTLVAGDRLEIRGNTFKAEQAGENRLQLLAEETTEQIAAPKRITRPIRVHCGYHKCLTMFSRKIYKRASIAYGLRHGLVPNRPTSFRHFYHRLDNFYNQAERYGLSSISGHCLDLNRFDDIKVVRFIRDPRDLIISSYFYHKRGAERWSRLANPVDLDWMIVNGAVPTNMPKGPSLAEYLKDVSIEEGLFAEIEFRKNHLESMMAWPTADDRVRLFQYEDIIGNEVHTFEEIFNFFQLPVSTKITAKYVANKFRAGKSIVKKDHIRNTNSQQWRALFTPELKQKFNDQYADLLERYGYPLD